MKGTGLCYQLGSFFLIQAVGLKMSLWSERCFIAVSWHSQHLPVKRKQKRKRFLIRPNCARTVNDQTQVRSNTPPIRSNCAKTVYDPTQVRWDTPMIRIFRPNWTLTGPTPDRGPDCSALELSSTPCNFGLGTHGCALDWVWSESNLGLHLKLG